MIQPTLIDLDLDLRPGDEIVLNAHRWRVLGPPPNLPHLITPLWQIEDKQGRTEIWGVRTLRWILRDGGIVLRDGKQVAV